MHQANSLKNQIVKGVAWSAGAKLVTQVLSWASTFIVIRQLAPTDYGLVAIAFAVMGIFTIIGEFGLSDALIQKKSLSSQNICQVFSANFALNTIIFLSIYAAAEPFATFYKEPRLTPVLIFLAANLLLMSFVLVPEALLNRQLKFKQRAAIETISHVFNALVTLISALMGFGYWAILLGLVVNTIAKLVLLNLFNSMPYRFTFSFSGSYSLFSFGLFTFLSRFLWTIHTRIDAFVLGKLYSTHALGVYAIGKQFSALPLDKLSGIVNQVALAGFSEKNRYSSSQSDEHLFQSLSIIALFMVPVFFGMSLVAEPMVFLLIGPQWNSAIPFVSIMCFAMPFKLFGSLIDTYISAKGKPVINLIVSLFYLITTVFAIYLGSTKDILYMANILVVIYIVSFHLVILVVSYKFNIEFTALVKAYGLPIIWSFLMYVFVYIISEYHMKYFDTWFLLVAQICLGVLSYSLFIWLFGRRYVQLLMSFLSKRQSSSNN
jgi:O-antigen/teichoic acid export membrane protein